MFRQGRFPLEAGKWTLYFTNFVVFVLGSRRYWFEASRGLRQILLIFVANVAV